MLTTQHLRAKWTANETTLNAWLSVPNSWTAELLAHSDFDTLTIDTQHGLATDLAVVLPMLQAIATTQKPTFVRLPDHSSAFIMRLLDAGVSGLICPMVNNRAEAEAFVQSCLYPPKGIRSFGPTRANLLFKNGNYDINIEKEILKFVMIETRDAIENIEEIAQTPNLDGFYVGPWDLSLSMGFEKKADYRSEEFEFLLAKIIDVARRNGLIIGIHCSSSVEMGHYMRAIGFDFITVYSDTQAIVKQAQETIEKMKGSINEIKIIY